MEKKDLDLMDTERKAKFWERLPGLVCGTMIAVAAGNAYTSLKLNEIAKDEAVNLEVDNRRIEIRDKMKDLAKKIQDEQIDSQAVKKTESEEIECDRQFTACMDILKKSPEGNIYDQYQKVIKDDQESSFRLNSKILAWQIGDKIKEGADIAKDCHLNNLICTDKIRNSLNKVINQQE